MKITITRANLVALVARCTPIAKAKTTRPELSCLLLEQGQGVLTVSATDLYLSVVSRCLSEGGDKGAVCVNAKDLATRVATFPEGPITLALVDDKLHLSAGKRKHRLPTIPVEDFPKLDCPELAAGWKLDAEKFSQLLTLTRPAAYDDPTRAQLHGVALSTKGDTLVAAATDGHHLHVAEYPDAGRMAAPIIVPLPAVDALISLLTKASGEMTLALTGNRLSVQLGDTVFSSALVDAKFPPIADILDKPGPLVVEVGRETLADALRSVSLASADGTLAGLVVATIEGDEMTLTGEGKGAASDVIALDAPSPEAFQFAHFTPLSLSALSLLPSDSPARLHLGPDPLSPIRLTSPALPGFVAIVMPCKS